MTSVIRDRTGRVLHKVTTIRVDRADPPLALCRLCGWSHIADRPGGRAEARARARQHLQRPLEWPVFHRGQASLIGGRDINADHAAVYVDDVDGKTVAWAVADGIGDRQDAALAARVAADTAVRKAVGDHLDPVAALLAARDELLRDHDRTGGDGDAVMVVAVARTDTDGYELAWVGDCRGYEQRDGQLIQLTTDHTYAEEARTWARETYGNLDSLPPWWQHHVPRWEHVVTSTVASATPVEIGQASTMDRRTRLVLTSDGVHKPVPHQLLAELVATTADPRTCAHLLALASHGGTDNATALVIDPVATS